MIHILPHWNFADGEEVRVMTHTNCSEAELFLNGKSLGKRTLISTIWRIGLFRLKKVLLKWSDILTAKRFAVTKFQPQMRQKIIITPAK